jgi:hypothetical protein
MPLLEFRGIVREVTNTAYGCKGRIAFEWEDKEGKKRPSSVQFSHETLQIPVFAEVFLNIGGAPGDDKEPFGCMTTLGSIVFVGFLFVDWSSMCFFVHDEYCHILPGVVMRRRYQCFGRASLKRNVGKVRNALLCQCRCDRLSFEKKRRTAKHVCCSHLRIQSLCFPKPSGKVTLKNVRKNKCADVLTLP